MQGKITLHYEQITALLYKVLIETCFVHYHYSINSLHFNRIWHRAQNFWKTIVRWTIIRYSRNMNSFSSQIVVAELIFNNTTYY